MLLTFLTSPLFHTLALACDKPRFFGLVPWYEYLTLQPVRLEDPNGGAASTVCQITNFTNDSTQSIGAHSPILLIALAIFDDLLRIAALVAVGYIIYGGFQYMTSQGAPDATKRAQQTIINALIGVAVSIIAASAVAFLAGRLAGY